MPLPSSSRPQKLLRLPIIDHDDSFVTVVKSLSVYFVDELTLPSTYEQLRTTSAGKRIHILVHHLVRNVTNPALINALLTLKWHFSTLEEDDHRLNETRAYACEMAAYRFLSQISERDVVDFCLYELPPLPARSRSGSSIEPCEADSDEQSSLLPQFRAHDSQPATPISTRPEISRIKLLHSLSKVSLGGRSSTTDQFDHEEDPTSSFTGLNGLEIAAVADCKRFLSQRHVQNVVQSIFHGRIIFFQTLDANAIKKPQLYNKRRSDPFIRLRVPKYIKLFEVLFFAVFLALYYTILIDRDQYNITPFEVLFYVWLAAFAYDELGEFIDAGSLFYTLSMWNGADLAIILIGFVFGTLRIIGLIQGDQRIVETAFNILCLMALFLIPRLCSILSIFPYFGTLIPCLQQMAKDFVKFMAVVAIIYLGFLTTFTLLARDKYTLAEMSWILIKVFLGSSYLGFDIMGDIDPHLGPPLMLIFVCISNILLITSLISILSDSFSRVISHSREEYLFVYSIFVLESSTSNRRTHYYPPFNLIPLMFLRPLRLFFSAEKIREARIILLKITHSPIVGLIFLYESVYRHMQGTSSTFPSIGPSIASTSSEPVIGNMQKQRPFLSSRSNANPNSGHYVEISEDGASDDGRYDYSTRDFLTKGKKPVGDMLVVSNTELENKVADLSAKIAELTALMLAKQDGVDE